MGFAAYAHFLFASFSFSTKVWWWHFSPPGKLGHEVLGNVCGARAPHGMEQSFPGLCRTTMHGCTLSVLIVVKTTSGMKNIDFGGVSQNRLGACNGSLWWSKPSGTEPAPCCRGAGYESGRTGWVCFPPHHNPVKI